MKGAVKKIVNFVGFQAAWSAAVFGAAGGQTLLGPAAVLVWLAVYAFLSGRPKLEMQIALTALLLGLAIDTLLIGAGAYTPQGLIGGLPVTPPWMLALWVNFGTLVNGGLSWLQGPVFAGSRPGGLGRTVGLLFGPAAGGLDLSPAAGLPSGRPGSGLGRRRAAAFLSGGKVPGKARTAPRKGSQRDGLSIQAFLPLLISRSKRSLIGNNQYFRTIGWVNWF